MRAFVFSALLSGLLFAVLLTSVHAVTDCSDVLTFNYNGHSKLPTGPFDYNTSVDSIRVVAIHPGAFSFANVSQNYFYAAVDPYPPLNVNVSTIIFQYTPPNTDYYYSVLNGSSLPWSCDSGKMTDLSLSNTTLNGSFVDQNGQPINATSVPVLVFDSNIDNGFFVPNFGTMRKLFVAMHDEIKEIPGGYIVYDAGNGKFVATGFKQAQFHMPASAVPFCLPLASSCLDSKGIHAPQCQGTGVQTYSCYDHACISNLTACSYGCSGGACMAVPPAPSATPVVTMVASSSSANPSVSNPVSPSATASAAPASGFDVGIWELLIPLAVILAGVYYFFGRKRRHKGL